jgi:hypothetical protein
MYRTPVTTDVGMLVLVNAGNAHAGKTHLRDVFGNICSDFDDRRGCGSYLQHRTSDVISLSKMFQLHSLQNSSLPAWAVTTRQHRGRMQSRKTESLIAPVDAPKLCEQLYMRHACDVRPWAGIHTGSLCQAITKDGEAR